MKRLLILWLFAFPCFAAHDFSGAYRHPSIPEAKEVALDPPQTTNTFCAANLTCGVTAPWTFTTLTAKQTNGSAVVDANCLTNWGSADLGACINAAYAAAPASGADILISPTPNGNGSGCTNFSTPIVFNTLHKVAFLHGPPGQIVCLNYTPTTGTAITFDYGNTLTGNAGLGPGYGHGMYGILINGPSASGSVVGLAIGTTNGSEGLSFESGGIMNVGTAITFGGGINFFQKFKHFVIGPTNLAFNLTVPIENVTFEHVKFECSFSGPTSACIQFTNSSGLTDVNFTQSSLDNSAVSVNSSCGATCVRVAFNESHIEVTANSTQDLVNIQGGTVSISQTEMNFGPNNGPANSPSEMITCNTGNCSLSLVGNYYGFGCTTCSTPVVNQTNGSKVKLDGDVFVSPNFSSTLKTDATTQTSGISVWLPAQGSHYSIPKIIYDTQSSATNSNISTVTMATQGTGLAVSNTYRVSFYAAVVTPGTSCTGNTTVNLNLIYTDPNGASSQTLAVTLGVATGNNGTAGGIVFPNSGPPVIPSWIINAKAGSTIQWSTTSFTAGTGCSPAPTYQITPRLETM